MGVATAAAVVGAVGAVGGAVASSRASRRAANAQEDATNQTVALQREIYNQNRADLAPVRQTGNYAFQEMARQLGLPTYDPTDRTFDGGYQSRAIGTGYQFNQPSAPNFDPRTGGSIPSYNPHSPETLDQQMGGNVYEFPSGSRLPQGGRFGAFETSPGYQFNFDETLRGASAAASAGGYLGSGRAAKEAAQYASGLASNEYGNYFNRLAPQTSRILHHPPPCGQGTHAPQGYSGGRTPLTAVYRGSVSQRGGWLTKIDFKPAQPPNALSWDIGEPNCDRR